MTMDMHNHEPAPRARFAASRNRSTSGSVRSALKGTQNAQRIHDRYVALADAAALTGDSIAAENYYQHAEHFFRSMGPGVN